MRGKEGTVGGEAEVSPEIAEHLKSLAAEMEKLISENFVKSPNDVVQARLAVIRQEIYSLGCDFKWQAFMDPTNPEKLTAKVEIFVPRKDLSPEGQKIYDDWFAKVNKIKN